MTISVRTTAVEPGSGIAEARLNTAACYRLLALYGLNDLTDGFVSCRVDNQRSEFIIGGYGLLPEFAKASELHQRSVDRAPKLEKFSGVDIDAHNFTRATLTARPEFNACIHAHAEHCVVFSSLDMELEPVTQYGIMFHDRIGYLDYTDSDVTQGTALQDIETLFRDGAELLILRNHGALIPGRTVAQAFFHLYRLEQACRYQLKAMSSGSEFRYPNRVDMEVVRNQYWTMTHVDNDGQREWPALLRRLDEVNPGFRD